MGLEAWVWNHIDITSAFVERTTPQTVISTFSVHMYHDNAMIHFHDLPSGPWMNTTRHSIVGRVALEQKLQLTNSPNATPQLFVRVWSTWCPLWRDRLTFGFTTFGQKLIQIIST
jgi:hypothetical protein